MDGTRYQRGDRVTITDPAHAYSGREGVICYVKRLIDGTYGYLLDGIAKPYPLTLAYQIARVEQRPVSALGREGANLLLAQARRYDERNG